MKLYSQATYRVGNHQNKGFTLIEMIGVLAVIAILAAVLVPKVFEAINNAKVNNAAMSCQTVKTAIADHYAKVGSIPSELVPGSPTNTVLPLPQEQYDQVLMTEQFLDKPFATKIGDGTSGATGTRVRAFDITGNGFTMGAAVDGTIGTGFALSGGSTNTMVGSAGVEAVITGVTANDAKDLNDRIDGPSLGAALNADDFNGRVKYAAPVNGVTTVYIYLTHR